MHLHAHRAEAPGPPPLAMCTPIAQMPAWDPAVPYGQVHMGMLKDPPGVIYLGAEGYRARLHSALTLEPVLARHPNLRVYVMHAGWPMIDDMMALLYAHPQVYVDIGVIVYTHPVCDAYLEELVRNGYGTRILFGSDQMVWPEVIECSIDRIRGADYLTDAQKRDILYNNTVRFLRLSQEEVAWHRAGG